MTGAKSESSVGGSYQAAGSIRVGAVLSQKHIAMESRRDEGCQKCDGFVSTEHVEFVIIGCSFIRGTECKAFARLHYIVEYVSFASLRRVVGRPAAKEIPVAEKGSPRFSAGRFSTAGRLEANFI